MENLKRGQLVRVVCGDLYEITDDALIAADTVTLDRIRNMLKRSPEPSLDAVEKILARHVDAPHVEACRQGGGFCVYIPSSDIVDWNAEPVGFRRARCGFDCEGLPVVEGYVNEMRWNGWLSPHVDREN